MSITKSLKTFLLFTLATLLILFNHQAFSQINDQPILNEKQLYLVKDIAMTATGENPTQARDVATTKAQREALLTLFTRLNIDLSFADDVTDDEIITMIKSQQITSEKFAGNDYYAIFNFEFAKEFVDDFFNKKRIKQNEVKDENIVLIPIKIAREKLLIWEGNNDWMSVSEAIIQDRSFDKIRIPRGDSSDKTLINHDNLRNIDFSKAKPLLEKYKGDVLYIAYFEFDDIENKTVINLKILRKYQTKDLKLGFVNIENLDYDSMVKKVSEKLLQYILNPKNKSIDDQSVQTKVDLMILINNLNDWLEIKNKIEASNLVSSITITAISKDFVKVSANYINKDEGIVEAFAKIGLDLNQRYENYYIIQPQNAIFDQ